MLQGDWDAAKLTQWKDQLKERNVRKSLQNDLPPLLTVQAAIPRGKLLHKKTFYKENVLAQLISWRLHNNHFTKILWLVFLKKGHTSGRNITKKIIWWNSFCDNCRNYYKRESSKELFCNNFGQDGTCAFFCLRSRSGNSMHIHICDKFLSTIEFELDTRIPPLSQEMTWQIQIHIRENVSWLTHSNSIRIHTRQKSLGIENVFIPACLVENEHKYKLFSQSLLPRPCHGTYPTHLRPYVLRPTSSDFDSCTCSRKEIDTLPI